MRPCSRCGRPSHLYCCKACCDQWAETERHQAEYYAERVDLLESDLKMLDELLRAIGAKDGSCALEGLRRLEVLARTGLGSDG